MKYLLVYFLLAAIAATTAACTTNSSSGEDTAQLSQDERAAFSTLQDVTFSIGQ